MLAAVMGMRLRETYRSSQQLRHRVFAEQVSLRAWPCQPLIGDSDALGALATLSRSGHVTQKKPFGGYREVPGMPQRAVEFPRLFRSSHGRFGD